MPMFAKLCFVHGCKTGRGGLPSGPARSRSFGDEGVPKPEVGHEGRVRGARSFRALVAAFCRDGLAESFAGP